MAINANTNVDLSQSGFMAIQPPAITGPKAKRKVVQGPDGTPHVVYVDLDTGAELQNLSGYQVIDSGNYSDLDSLGLSPTAQDTKKETTAQKTIKSVAPNPTGPRSGAQDRADTSKTNYDRAQNNNFGYINQPGFLGVASMVPGMVGTAAKAAKVGIGMNNNAAINAARNRLGLPDQSFGSSVKGAVKDQKGVVANVNIGPGQYTVGLEAQDKQGKTTMTPDEAARRAVANKVAVTEQTEDEVAARQRDFDDAWGKQKGVIGSFTSKVSSFVDSIFGTQETQAEKSSRSMNTGSSFNPSRSGFADAIGATSGVGKSATSTPNSPVSGAARSTAGKVSKSGGGSGRADSSSSKGGARAGSGGSEGASARSGGTF